MFIQEMEDKYKPDDKHKLQMKTLLYKLLDPNPNITDEIFEGFLRDAEKRYQRIQELANIRQSSQEGLANIKKNLGYIADSYQKQADGVKEMVGHVVGIAEKVKEVEETCKRMEQASDTASKNVKRVSKNLEKIKKDCEQAENDLDLIMFMDMPPKGTA